jgi:hypothetical protein
VRMKLGVLEIVGSVEAGLLDADFRPDRTQIEAVGEGQFDERKPSFSNGLR